MKILQINTVYGKGSTGKICEALYDKCEEKGYKCKIGYRFFEDQVSKENTIAISSWLDCHIHNRFSIMTGLQGCFSTFHTWLFFKKVKKYKPDIIHLHNIHGSYINHRMLFNFIKKNGVPVVWTLHDCWSFTGGCPHFVEYLCDKWKYRCKKCPYMIQNKKTIIDMSSLMWKNKKRWFTSVPNMTIVCPSHWLANLIKESYMKDYTVKVIHNGINLEIFKPTESDFREKYKFENKKIILGVSFVWNKKKGIDIFETLANILPDNYQVVLIGTDENTDKLLPQNIVSIHRTQNQKELAEIYTAADVFVNPTREENYPTVNMEAIACGTPVITFRTGGSPEIIDETCGCVVEKDDIDAMEREIIRICEEKPYSKEACIKKAKAFDENERFKEYVELYERIVTGRA